MLSIKEKDSIPSFPSFLLQGILGVYMCLRERKKFEFKEAIAIRRGLVLKHYLSIKKYKLTSMDHWTCKKRRVRLKYISFLPLNEI